MIRSARQLDPEGDYRVLMAPIGCLINIVSSPEIYLHEWVSFSTKCFPENKEAKTGEIVRIVTCEFKSGKPAEDILCTAEAYRAIYDECELRIVAEERSSGRDDGGVTWSALVDDFRTFILNCEDSKPL